MIFHISKSHELVHGKVERGRTFVWKRSLLSDEKFTVLGCDDIEIGGESYLVYNLTAYPIIGSFSFFICMKVKSKPFSTFYL